MKSKWFKQSEFACKCGCGKADMSQKLVDLLNRIREIIHQPMVIASGFRCEKRNAAVGGVSESSHMHGLAVDVYAPNSRTKFLIVQAAIAVGIHRIGVGTNFVHLDIDDSKPQEVLWTYSAKEA